MMAYQVYRPVTGEWDVQVPIDELKAMLDRHPDGVSFVVEGMGVVQWRKTPRDHSLLAAIARCATHQLDPTEVADAVYDLLEKRGLV